MWAENRFQARFIRRCFVAGALCAPVGPVSVHSWLPPRHHRLNLMPADSGPAGTTAQAAWWGLVRTEGSPGTSPTLQGLLARVAEVQDLVEARHLKDSAHRGIQPA